MILRTAEFLAEKGVNLMRAGAFKPRTSMYAFQGMGQKGLDILAQTRQKTGIGVVTELMDADHADGAESLVTHMGRADRAGWLKEQGFGDGYPIEGSLSGIFCDFVTSLQLRYTRDCYECAKCGRLWIESPRERNLFICFTPETEKYERVLGPCDAPTPNTSQERTREE